MTHGNIRIVEQLPSQTKLDGCQSVSKYGAGGLRDSFWNTMAVKAGKASKLRPKLPNVTSETAVKDGKASELRPKTA